MLLAPRHSNLSQGCITIPVPLFGNSVRANPIFEVTERASPTDGVTQIIPYVLVVYREAETLHNPILVDLEAVGQQEIVIRLQNLPSDTNRVMLPFREVFKGLFFLSRS